MIRGMLSNRSSPVCLVDYDILIKSVFNSVAIEFWVSKILLESYFTNWLHSVFSIKEGAKEWFLRNNGDVLIKAFFIGAEPVGMAVKTILETVPIEMYLFDSKEEFRQWLRQNPDVYKVLTKDKTLIGLDNVIRYFGGWTEGIDGL